MAIAPDYIVRRVRLQNNATHTVKLEYRQKFSTTWILVGTGYQLDNQGYLTPEAVISGLESNIQYEMRATDEYCGISAIEQLPIYYIGESPISEGQWLPSASVCEQGDVFFLDRQITGLSSPAVLLYDTETELIFMGDYDDVTGAFAYADPLTAASKADFTYIQPVFSGSVPPAQRYYYGWAIDRANRRLLMCGKDTDGLQSYSIPTGAITVVPYGNNINIPPNPPTSNIFNRTVIYVMNTEYLCPDAASQTLNIINRANLTLTATIPYSSIIDSEKCLRGSPSIIQVGNEYWVTQNLANSTQAPDQSPNIFRYDLNFANPPVEIDISAWCSTWSNGAYTRFPIYIPEANAFYLVDIGGNSFIKIDTNTFVATRIKQFLNRRNKSNSNFSFVKDPITGDWYMSGSYQNAITDGSPINTSYRFNPATDLLEVLYPGILFQNLERIGDTDFLWGNAPGNVAWSGASGWDTDGVIPIFNKAGMGDNNTGIKITTQLEFNDPPIPPGTPTGQFKANIPGDPDYYPPTEDLTDCEVTYTTDCPTTVGIQTTGLTGQFRYEFTLPIPVITNTAQVRKVRVSAMQGSIEAAFDLYTLPNANPQLFEGLITLPAGNYILNISYFDEDDNLTQLCSGLASFTVA